MVMVRVEMEAPSTVAADGLHRGLREWCANNDGWRLVTVSFAGTAAEACPECGGQMRFDSDLLAHVCSHGEDA